MLAKPNSLKKLAGWVLAFFLVSVFTSLGIWQLKRLAYKEALIAKVENRAFNLPVELPEVARWSDIDRERYEYTRVTLCGRFVDGDAPRTLAVTELGAGYWILAPFAVEQGYTVWVNAGFVPQKQEQIDLPSGAVEVVGLLRITEPNGGFLRDNQPKVGRWYSRDVAALSTWYGVDNAAPYFVDAFEIRPIDPSGKLTPKAPLNSSTYSFGANGNPANKLAPAPGGQPITGLTVLHFANNHLSYALTWFAMALGTLAITVWLSTRKSA